MLNRIKHIQKKYDPKNKTDSDIMQKSKSNSKCLSDARGCRYYRARATQHEDRAKDVIREKKGRRIKELFFLLFAIPALQAILPSRIKDPFQGKIDFCGPPVVSSYLHFLTKWLIILVFGEFIGELV